MMINCNCTSCFRHCKNSINAHLSSFYACLWENIRKNFLMDIKTGNMSTRHCQKQESRLWCPHWKLFCLETLGAIFWFLFLTGSLVHDSFYDFLFHPSIPFFLPSPFLPTPFLPSMNKPQRRGTENWHDIWVVFNIFQKNWVWVVWNLPEFSQEEYCELGYQSFEGFVCMKLLCLKHTTQPYYSFFLSNDIKPTLLFSS